MKLNQFKYKELIFMPAAKVSKQSGKHRSKSKNTVTKSNLNLRKH